MLSSIKQVKSSKRDAENRSIEQSEEEIFWEQDPDCSGFTVSDKNCSLRVVEMELVTYQPFECSSGAIPECKDLVAYARYNVTSNSIQDAQLQFQTTIFTCIIMCIGSLMFSSDTDKIIILPITKMVGIIKQLADDPLQKPDSPIFTDDEINFKAKN
mmetsp:Transcript_9805/g.16515  ORF Transcript_9805/g.16515 Transcript_9805/m.16515 type:complete len:157 (+) Transcript_9805:863-1333(+)